MSAPGDIGIDALVRFSLNTPHAEALARFYVDVLGFAFDASRRTGPETTALQLGGTRLDLIEVGHDAGPYPGDVPGWSPLFQHFAIVVTDMSRAIRRLRQSAEWTAITVDGPQRLPPNTGSVTAFKFRDPDGHPLELIEAADANVDAPSDTPFRRIDHSAISVADVARSIAFYEALGLEVHGRTFNSGIEQQRLDAIDDAEVDVIGLAPRGTAKPHVELLGYRGRYERTGRLPAVDDVAATRLVFSIADDATRRTIVARADRLVTRGDACLLRDPDGHLVQLVVSS